MVLKSGHVEKMLDLLIVSLLWIPHALADVEFFSSVSAVSGKSRELFATRSLPEGHVLLRVSADEVISSFNPPLSPAALHAVSLISVANLPPFGAVHPDPTVVLTIVIYLELLRGPQSRWANYFATLPLPPNSTDGSWWRNIPPSCFSQPLAVAHCEAEHAHAVAAIAALAALAIDGPNGTKRKAAEFNAPSALVSSALPVADMFTYSGEKDRIRQRPIAPPTLPPTHPAAGNPVGANVISTLVTAAIRLSQLLHSVESTALAGVAGAAAASTTSARDAAGRPSKLFPPQPGDLMRAVQTHAKLLTDLSSALMASTGAPLVEWDTFALAHWIVMTRAFTLSAGDVIGSPDAISIVTPGADAANHRHVAPYGAAPRRQVDTAPAVAASSADGTDAAPSGAPADPSSAPPASPGSDAGDAVNAPERCQAFLRFRADPTEPLRFPVGTPELVLRSPCAAGEGVRLEYRPWSTSALRLFARNHHFVDSDATHIASLIAFPTLSPLHLAHGCDNASTLVYTNDDAPSQKLLECTGLYFLRPDVSANVPPTAYAEKAAELAAFVLRTARSRVLVTIKEHITMALAALPHPDCALDAWLDAPEPAVRAVAAPHAAGVPMGECSSSSSDATDGSNCAAGDQGVPDAKAMSSMPCELLGAVFALDTSCRTADPRGALLAWRAQAEASGLTLRTAFTDGDSAVSVADEFTTHVRAWWTRVRQLLTVLVSLSD